MAITDAGYFWTSSGIKIIGGTEKHNFMDVPLMPLRLSSSSVILQLRSRMTPIRNTQ
jgi:hypothetical protein